MPSPAPENSAPQGQDRVLGGAEVADREEATRLAALLEVQRAQADVDRLKATLAQLQASDQEGEVASKAREQLERQLLETQRDLDALRKHRLDAEDVGIIGAPNGPARTLPPPPGTGIGGGRSTGTSTGDFGLPRGENAGQVDLSKLRELADNWGHLPEKERAKAILALKRMEELTPEELRRYGYDG